MNPPSTFLDRGDNPFFGGYQASNVVEGTITRVHVDEANNVTMTCDVVTIKNESKVRVPLMLPYASADGRAGVFSIPNVGDKCLIALAAGNQAYVIGYHPSGQMSQGRASASLASSDGSGESQKGTFSKNQLIPGAIELRSPAQNRILVHPGGSIAIDARQDLFTFYDAISSTVETLSRQSKTYTAGGQLLWTEGLEKSKRSMSLSGTFYTKSATKENLDAGELRDGARMSILFSEQANHFFLEVTDKDDITSRISIGPGGIILTSSDGTNQGSIAIGPSGSFSFIAGDPLGDHTQLDLAPAAAALSAFSGMLLKASVQVDTVAGTATVTAASKVTVDAPIVETTKLTQLALGGLGVARLQSLVQVDGVMNGGGAAIGRVITSSGRVQAGL